MTDATSRRVVWFHPYCGIAGDDVEVLDSAEFDHDPIRPRADAGHRH